MDLVKVTTFRKTIALLLDIRHIRHTTFDLHIQLITQYYDRVIQSIFDTQNGNKK